MSGASDRWRIAGQGLAGTCLAWAMWRRGLEFEIIDPGRGGSSRVAAGLVNPVTGKNFEPSWRIGDFLPEALAFYHEVELLLGRKFWHSLPVLRLAGTAGEWGKIEGKLGVPEVSRWVVEVADAPNGWTGAVVLGGGGRLDVAAFLEASREFFAREGRVAEVMWDGDGEVVDCRGAEALIEGCLGPHRCAKGEILTVRAGWDEGRIVVAAGGWLVPVGGGHFRTGSTYEWHDLDERPTVDGRRRIEERLRVMVGGDYEVVDHVAGVRPILRRSMPLIGPAASGWVFNGLGSKGSLYAPGMADRLARWMAEGEEPEAELDVREFRQGGKS
jgi:glycine oxidase